MIEINIANEFTTSPGARYYDDGRFSGEEFYEKLLKPRFQQALDDNDKLKIVLDGTDGIASSFINEAFRRLGDDFGADKVWPTLLLISDEVPKYVNKIKDSIYESK